MKKPAYNIKKVFVILMLLMGTYSFSQSFVPFGVRFDQDVKGDIQLIGNNILGPTTIPFNDNTVFNNLIDMRYIDIDGNSGPNRVTYNSSSADLTIPNTSGCYEIIHAGLYWSAATRGTTSITDIMFKGPTGGYQPVTGTVIFDAAGVLVANDNLPYACFADVTDIVRGFTTNTGTYTVGNVSTAQGISDDVSNRTGYAAGWSLYIVYEDPTLTGKSITSFDGFSSISSFAAPLPITVDGFRTIPVGPVRANLAYAALEGDKPISGDGLQINGTDLSTLDRPIVSGVPNFFNSSISQLSGLPVNNRNPNSTNTLGFDTGIMSVPNPGNGVITNGATQANLSLSTTGDTYFPYFFALAVEIIEPKIVLTKIVQNTLGQNINGQIVDLGDELNYVLGFRNTGNDNATNLFIRDVLPTNIVFNYPADILPLPSGVEVSSYDPVTRELVFEVTDDDLVLAGGDVTEIRFRVTVVRECSLLSDACSNIVSNQAFSRYNGTLNTTFEITDDPSFNNNVGCLLNTQATNFLSDIICPFQDNVILCGDSTTITAASGYDSYSWSRNANGVPVIATTRTITVTDTGTYYSANTAVAPCQSITQEFEVITFGEDVTINPLSTFADEEVLCNDDGVLMPNFYLCGGNDTRDIQTGIVIVAQDPDDDQQVDAVEVIWERLRPEVLDPGIDQSDPRVAQVCLPFLVENCANTSNSCTWDPVQTGADYTIDTAGEYRLTINYDGGCFNQFYFNVFENDFTPTATPRDITCNTSGQITVGNTPSGYEYSIDNIDYQASNVLPVPSAGIYTVYVRQIGVTNPCVFTTDPVQIRERNFTASAVVTAPLCHDDKGSILLTANDVGPQYEFSIFQGVTLIDATGLVNGNSIRFDNLDTNIEYTVNVLTEDGCTYTAQRRITNPPELTATASVTTPLTCGDAQITIVPNGGTITSTYFYFVNSTGPTDFQTTPIIDIPAAEAANAPLTYNIRVVDANNCFVDLPTITVDGIPDPEFDVVGTNISCYNENTGVITFTNIVANGHTLEFSIDGGANYSSNTTYPNLTPGTYSTRVRYTFGGVECLTTAEDITITQPAEALTASGGVSELAGCGNNGEGTIRVTNPQGGTPPYEYSFDNQNTWGSINEDEVSPGTYTIYVRDSAMPNPCVFAMPNIILDPEPVPPTIIIGEPDYNCDGTANAVVTASNPGTDSYTYTYAIDGVNTPDTDLNDGVDSVTFPNVAQGTHTVTVSYELNNIPTFSNLLNETFGYGDSTTSPGINSSVYCFEAQEGNTAECGGDTTTQDDQYSVTSTIENPFGTWLNPTDHTPPTSPVTPKGRYLLVNVGNTIDYEASIYEKVIDDIIPGKLITVELYAINLLKSSSGGVPPNLTIALIDEFNNLIDEFETGEIDKTEQWERFSTASLDPGMNTSLRFIVRSNVRWIDGNDVAIDDIRVFQEPLACPTEVNFPFIVNSGNAFAPQIQAATDVTCFGFDDGTITLDVQNFDTTTGYEYSTDNGANWNTETTSPFVIRGLAPDNYVVRVRYDNTPDCDFTFNQPINTPALLEVTASGTPVTCIAGSTVTAEAKGGRIAYSYELLDETLTFVSDFPPNGVLTNVDPGDYIVRVTDASNCTAVISPVLKIADVTLPTATIDAASNYCYEPVNGATLIVVGSGGLAPYEYSSDGGTNYDTNNTFDNLTPGNYNIRVRDANFCESPVVTETIEPQLLITALPTKGLDCTTSPDGTIAVTITGGTLPYTKYEVDIDGIGYVEFTPTAVTVSGGNTTFAFTAEDPVTYKFKVTDSKTCESESSTRIDPISNPSATPIVVQPKCNGIANGSIDIVPSGGVGPYVYNFNGNGFTTVSLYENLLGGTAAVPITYTYQVRDSKNCTSQILSVDLIAPTALEVTPDVTNFMCDATTNASVEATIELTVTIGTGTQPYEYSFNGGAGYGSLNTLTVSDNGTPQTINYIVKDGGNCEFPGQVVLQPLSRPTDLSFAENPAVTCSGLATVTLTPTGGVPGLTGLVYTIESSTGTINTTGVSSGIFTDLTAGTYRFRVTDANGCYYEDDYKVDPVTNISVVEGGKSDVDCNNGNDGEVTFTVTNFGSTYSYIVTDGASTPIDSGTGETSLTVRVPNLTAETYTIVVTDDTTDCTNTESIIVSQPATAVTLAPKENLNANCNIGARVTVEANGGTGPYTYAFVENNVTPVPTDYTDSPFRELDPTVNTEWDVYVLDTSGCTTASHLDVIIATDPLPAVTVPTIAANQCNIAGDLYTFTVTSPTGIGPFMYSIDGGNIYQPSTTFIGLTPDTYTVTIKDVYGCVGTGNTSIVITEPLTASAIRTKDLTCSPVTATAEATIEVTILGGLSPYTVVEVSTDGGGTYSIITPTITPIVGGATFEYATSTPDTYRFQITDSNTPGGCEAITNEVIVNDAVEPDFTISNTMDISCNGEETAAIDVDIDTTIGVGPFTINVRLVGDNSVLPGITITDYDTQTTGLPAGDYVITVTDEATGCFLEKAHDITEPLAFDFSLPHVDITCNGTIGGGSTQGSITVSGGVLDTDPVSPIIGGTPPFTYSISNNFGDLITPSSYVAAAGEAFTFPDLDFGVYTIVVTDDKMCEKIETVTIASPPFDLIVTPNPIASDCTSGGTVDVEVISAFGIGNYEFGIVDQSGIPYASVYQGPTSGLTISRFTGLTPGRTYTFVVHDTTTNCYFITEAGAPIDPASSLLPTVEENNVTCLGENDGSVTLKLNGFDSTTTSVDYEILTEFTNVTTGITGNIPVVFGVEAERLIPSPGTLTPGRYYIELTENGSGLFNGCKSASRVFEIKESTIDLSVTPTLPSKVFCTDYISEISVVASGGTKPYTYAAATAASGAPDILTGYSSPNTLSLDTNSGADLNWVIYVKDAHNCVKMFPVTVINDPEPTVTTPAVPVNQCTVTTGFTFTAIPGVTNILPLSFSIDGSNFQPSPTFIVPNTGSYTVTVKDGNGCTATSTTPTVVSEPLTASAKRTKDLTCFPAPTAATIEVTINGGLTPYTTFGVSTDNGLIYTPITPVLVGATFIYTTSTPGTYMFEITDSNTPMCDTETNEVTVNIAAPPTVSVTTSVNPKCFGAANGSVQLEATGGVGPYTYSFDGSVFTSTSFYDTLSAGISYPYAVRDGKGCEDTGSITLTNPVALTTTASSPGFTCSTTTNAFEPAIVTIDVPTTGTSPYEYNFGSGFTATRTLTVNDTGSDQTISYTVKDRNGCMFIGTVPLSRLNPPTHGTITHAPEISCSVLQTTVTVAATVGTGVTVLGPLTYEILTPIASITSNTTGVFANLAPDTYTFRVTDDNGCYYEESYKVDPVTNISVVGKLESNVQCNNGNTGEVTFTVTDFGSTYSYIVTDGTGTVDSGTGQTATSIPVPNLTVGTYTIVVTDDVTDCDDTDNVPVSQPTQVTLSQTVDLNANCNIGARVTVEAINGTGPYTFAFVEDGVTPVFPTDYTGNASRELDPTVNTDWDVYVLDRNGCEALLPLDIDIEMDPLPIATVPTVAANQCNVLGDPYTFTVTNPVGIGPFEYSINGGVTYQSSTNSPTPATFTVNRAGSYMVRIKDGNGCTTDIPTTIEVYPPVDVIAGITTPPTCNASDGVITVNAFGGAGTVPGDYSYDISPRPASVILSGNVFSGVPPGSYTVTVTDNILPIATGCSDVTNTPVVIEIGTPVTFIPSSTPVTCFNGMDGVINIDLPASNDNPIYMYEITSGPMLRPAQTSPTFSGLVTGAYTVLVTSKRGCLRPENINVGTADLIEITDVGVIPYACTIGTNTRNTASITVNTVRGGSGIYTEYEFIRGTDQMYIGPDNVYLETDSEGGTYTINVRDNKGCLGTITGIIIDPFISIDDIVPTTIVPITCTNGEDVTFSVTSAGGSIPTNMSYRLEDLLVNNAGVSVYGSVYDETEISGNFTGLDFGSYRITATNLDTSCSFSEGYIVDDPNIFTLEAVGSEDTCSDGRGSAIVTFNPIADAGDFSYTLRDINNASSPFNETVPVPLIGAGPHTINNLGAGTYEIIGTLNNSPFCEAVAIFTINAPAVELGITATSSPITCANDDGSITASGFGGSIGGYEYQLEESTLGVIEPYSSVFNFTGLEAGDYTVSVRDSQNCVVPTSIIELRIPDPIMATVTASTNLLTCFGDTNASISVDATSITGGQGSNYSYSLNRILPVASSSAPQLDTNFPNLGAGTYTVTITDGFNCSFTSPEIIIAAPTEVIASLSTASTQTCLDNASLTLSATGGTGPYEYSNDMFTTVLGIFASSTTFTVADNAVYSYYVRDANMCISNLSNGITIDSKPILTVDIELTNVVINCAGDTGTISARAEGGLGNYIYTLQDAAGFAITPVTQDIDSPGVFTNLTAGNYQVQVTSGADCIVVSDPIVVTSPFDPITATYSIINHVTCSGENNGAVEIIANGGTGVYTYAISPELNVFQSQQPIFEDLGPGNYTVVFQDEINGCFDTIDFTINDAEPIIITLDTNSIIQELCADDMNGAFSVTVIGGTLPYSYSLDNAGGPYLLGDLTQTEFDFVGLEGGDHTLYIRDALECENQLDIPLSDPIRIDPEIDIDYGCENNTPTNIVAVTVDASITDLTSVDYSLNGGTYQASNIFTNVLSGSNIITARHINGCEKDTEAFIIDDNQPLVVVLNDGALNEIVTTTTGGSGDYTYDIQTVFNSNRVPVVGDEENRYIIYESGEYIVTVTDNVLGCVQSETRFFEFIDVCISNYFTPNGDGRQDLWGPGCTINYKDLTFEIFDRYGRKIADLKAGEQWDGKYNGEELPTGDYWYIVKLNDENDDRDFVGNFTLYR